MKDHNHISASQKDIQFLRSHRKISESDIAQAMTLRGIGIKTSKIIKLFVLQSGSYDKTRFTIKDLCHQVNKQKRKETLNGDIESGIAY